MCREDPKRREKIWVIDLKCLILQNLCATKRRKDLKPEKDNRQDMKNLIKSAVCFATLLLIVTGCSAPGKVAYIPDADKIPQQLLNQTNPATDPVLSAGDLLNIRVYASDMGAVAPFNKGQYLSPEGALVNTNSGTNTMGANAEASTEFYLVNSDGDIEFPMLGVIHAAGLTKQQLADLIRNDIYPKYIKERPMVEVRLMNFKVTVLGQVKSPGQYISKNERMNVLECIAMAGDLDIRGDRENVLLYRTNADGTREIQRLNLHDSNLLLSPYFNLQQNDLIYVEPNRSAKQNAWQMHQGWTASIAVVGGLTSVAGLVIGIINLSK